MGPGNKGAKRGSISSAKETVGEAVPVKRTRRSLAAAAVQDEATNEVPTKEDKRETTEETTTPKRTLSCLYCKLDIPSNATNEPYIHHLKSEHKIQFDLEFVVERTLRLRVLGNGNADLVPVKTEEALVVVKTEPDDEIPQIDDKEDKQKVEKILSSPEVVKPEILKKPDVVVKRTIP